MSTHPPIRLGISSCLLGEAVRYDRSHKCDSFLVQTLDQVSRRELASVIEDYRQGLIPLIVPLTLIRHHARRLDVSYLLGQRYLDPELKELMLRNHV
jgi:uncharacterized protein YbgA (DUF1722 family)